MTNRSRNAASRTPLLALALCAAIAGCKSSGSQNTYRGGDRFDSMQRIEGNRSLASKLAIVDPIQRVVDERLNVQIELVNRSSSSLRFAWDVSWYDAEGFLVDDRANAWQPVQLGGNGSINLTLTAPTPAATQWQLEVTSPNEVR